MVSSSTTCQKLLRVLYIWLPWICLANIRYLVYENAIWHACWAVSDTRAWMTHLNVELAYKRMHEVGIGTYLKADAVQLFLRCLQPAQGCCWAREIFKKRNLPETMWEARNEREEVSRDEPWPWAGRRTPKLALLRCSGLYSQNVLFLSVAGSNPASAYFYFPNFSKYFALLPIFPIFLIFFFRINHIITFPEVLYVLYVMYRCH